MSGGLTLLLAVMWLTTPDQFIDRAAAEAVSRDADRVDTAGRVPVADAVKSARITSRSTDFDRAEGVVMFEGDVVVRYSEDFLMCADKLYMFAAGSNELSRVVAVGNVSITNDLRVGTCGLAIYRRKKGEIEMFGDGEERLAQLAEFGEANSTVAGTRIKFRLDAEQVEVENSQISSDQKGGVKVL